MLIIRLVMVHMGPNHTQYGQKTARLAPVLQNGLKGHVGVLTLTGALNYYSILNTFGTAPFHLDICNCQISERPFLSLQYL